MDLLPERTGKVETMAILTLLPCRYIVAEALFRPVPKDYRALGFGLDVARSRV